MAARTYRHLSIQARLQSFAHFAAGHFTSALAAFRMEDQRAISACTKVANFAGVRSAFTGIDNGRFPDAGELLPATRPEDRTLVSPGIVIETGPRPALSGVSIDR